MDSHGPRHFMLHNRGVDDALNYKGTQVARSFLELVFNGMSLEAKSSDLVGNWMQESDGSQQSDTCGLLAEQGRVGIPPNPAAMTDMSLNRWVAMSFS